MATLTQNHTTRSTGTVLTFVEYLFFVMQGMAAPAQPHHVERPAVVLVMRIRRQRAALLTWLAFNLSAFKRGSHSFMGFLFRLIDGIGMPSTSRLSHPLVSFFHVFGILGSPAVPIPAARAHAFFTVRKSAIFPPLVAMEQFNGFLCATVGTRLFRHGYSPAATCSIYNTMDGGATSVRATNG